MVEKSREINFDRLAKLKGFTSSILEQAIEGVQAGAVSFDLHRDYYTRGELLGKLNRVRECSTLLEMRHYEDGTKTLHNGNFCRVPIACSSCADRVSRRRKTAWAGRIEKAAARFKYVYFVTLTIKDMPDMENRLEKLIDSKKRFRLMGQRRGDKVSGGEWGKVQAALSNTEIKFGLGGQGVHAHEHILLFTNEYLDYEIYDSEKMKLLEIEYGRGNIPAAALRGAVREWYTPAGGDPLPVSKLSREWLAASGGEGFNIDVQYLSYKQWRENKTFKGFYCDSFPVWIRNHASEVLKYNSKLAEDFGKNPVSPAQYVELIQRRGSRRLFNSFGAFRRRGDPLFFSDVEQKWLEYVEERDKKKYSIHPAKYNGSGWSTGGAVESAIFDNSDKPDICKRRRLGEQARIVARYRRGRASIFFRRDLIPAALLDGWRVDAEKEINRIRIDMKKALRRLWHPSPGFDDYDYQGIPPLPCPS